MAVDHVTNRKVAILGLEAITATEIYSLLVSGRIRTVVLVGDRSAQLIKETREIRSFLPISIDAELVDGRIADCEDADIAVIGGPAGTNINSLDELRNRALAVRRAARGLKVSGFFGVIVITGSPIEILVRAAVEGSAFPKEKVFGIGNSSDIASLIGRFSACENVTTEPAQERCNSELPLGWCTAAGAEVSYIDSCSTDCPFFETLMASPAVAKPYFEGERPRSPQRLAACVTQVCEAVVDDLHTVMPVFVSKDGPVESSTCVITRDGVKEKLPDSGSANPLADGANLERLWSMVYDSAFTGVSRQSIIDKVH